MQRFFIECTINGAFLCPVWAYVDEGIYLVHQKLFLETFYREMIRRLIFLTVFYISHKTCIKSFLI